MRSRSIQLQPEAADVDGDSLSERSEIIRKQYSRSRSAKSPKRRTSRTTNASVPLGISARRNRRFAW